MSMISEQVKRLRKLGNQWKRNDVAAYNLIFDAADTIEALSEKVRANNLHEGWIPVSERLPKISGLYLVSTDQYGVWAARTDVFDVGTNSWAKEDDKITTINAWMPLPEPYREDGES